MNAEEKQAVLELVERWRDVYTDQSYWAAGKNLGLLSRAYLELQRDLIEVQHQLITARSDLAHFGQIHPQESA